jgi:hypothetical protein
MQTIMVPDLVPPSPEIRALCRVLPSLHEVRSAMVFGQQAADI